MPSDSRSSASDPLLSLLRQQEADLKRLFHRFAIPPAYAERILDDAFMTLVYRFDHLARPDLWLRRTVRSRCVTYWRRREARMLALEPEVHSWLRDEDATAAERSLRRDQLRQDIEALPRPCREPLLRHFRLEGDPEPAPHRCLRSLFRRWIRLLADPP